MNKKIHSINALHIYPIKGMQGISVSYSMALTRGMLNDRRYMLIDEKNTFISQRTHKKLVNMYTRIAEDTLYITCDDLSIDIPIDVVKGERVQAKLFDDTVTGTRVSKDVDDFFSSVLGESVSLLKMTDDDIRIKKLIKGPPQTEVSFADGYPYLIVGTASLDALNSKLADPILMNRFRPNIIVNTTSPHEEDNWDIIQVGSAKFQIIKPCARCQVVTIDQATGIQSLEPLTTLSTYRKVRNKVNFGANAICVSAGILSVGNQLMHNAG